MTKDDATWLNICYVVFAGIIAYVGFKGIMSVADQFGWAERYDEWFPLFSRFLAFGIGVGTAVWMWSSKERREYHLATIGELRKVTWPTLPDTKRMTIVVVVVVAIFSVILSAFDVAWSKILQTILP